MIQPAKTCATKRFRFALESFVSLLRFLGAGAVKRNGQGASDPGLESRLRTEALWELPPQKLAESSS
jgi:hypothetical protein